MKIFIRHATVDDYESICDLLNEIDKLHRDNLPNIFKKPTGPVRERDYFLELISDENVGLYIAELAGEMVGFVHAIVKDASDIPVFVQRRFATVDSLVEKKGFQNHGIGRLLMNKMQEWSIAKEATSIELNVYEFNKIAISFYEKNGYKTFSRRMSKELERKKLVGFG